MIDVDNIYAQMSEFSIHQARPHKQVMGFVYGHEFGPLTGGVTVWWEKPYVSNDQDFAEIDIVDWMHDHDLYLDSMVKLTPIDDKGLPGLMMTWRPIDGPAVIADAVLDYLGRIKLHGSDDPRTEDQEDRGGEDGATSE